jgi:hypothetical protein
LNLLPKAQVIGFSPSTTPLSNHLTCSVRRNGRSDSRVFANAKQCAERNAETASNGVIHVNGASSFPKLVQSEIVGLPASLEGDQGAFGEHCEELLKRSATGLADLCAREAFVISGEITETDMERLVESLMREEGQSMEDYRERAIMSGKIDEFFREGRTYSALKEESCLGATDATEIARTMQVIVDVVLAGDGRSATDYNCRAHLFAKSAEVFPFINDEVLSN